MPLVRDQRPPDNPITEMLKEIAYFRGKQNFEPQDSMIGSVLAHPLEGIDRFTDNVRLAQGRQPKYRADQGVYEPSIDQQLYGAFNLAGSANLGTMSFAPSGRGTLGTIKSIHGAKSMATAAKNAMLPIAEGGLGLRKGNTAFERAKAMGYDTDRKLYHGTQKVFDRFKPGESGMGKGVYLTDDLSEAKGYAYGNADTRAKGIIDNHPDANVMETLLRGKYADLRPNTFDTGGLNIQSLMEREGLSGMHKGLKGKGYDGIIMDDDTGLLPMAIKGNHHMVYDPKNIRSTKAAFDPLRKNSSNIMASGLLGLVLSEEYDRY